MAININNNCNSTRMMSRHLLLVISILLLQGFSHHVYAFVPASRTGIIYPSFVPISKRPFSTAFQADRQRIGTRRYLSTEIIALSFDDDDEDEDLYDDDDDDEDEVEDPYVKIAASEFFAEESSTPPQQREMNSNSTIPRSSSIVYGDNTAAPTTSLDWGGALGKLRQRVQDTELGKSQDPSHALFRLLSAPSPSQQISNFVNSASPGLVQAMSGAVGSLLGGLASPNSGVDVIIKASGEKMASLCFQLQMTGYMFRNAEYVVALKDLMKIRSRATIEDYKDAFEALDADKSGYIDASEIRDLLDQAVYDGKTPAFEVETFVKFFDNDKDGKISWNEFEQGIGSAMALENKEMQARFRLLDDHHHDYDDDDDDNHLPDLEPEISGTIEIELDDGNVVQADAKEYIDSLKEEARALKAALRREVLGDDVSDRTDFLPGMNRNGRQNQQQDFGAGIAEYIASRQGDIKALTEGISPEIVQTMKLLVDFVMGGGDSGKGPAAAAAAASNGKNNKAGKKKKDEMELEMELPASALQQLALWQLILGYRLREAEAKGDYLKLLE